MIDISLYRHMKSPFGYGRPERFNAFGAAGSADRQGPYFCVYLLIENEHLRELRFETYRCPWSMAAGSVLAKLAEGVDVNAVSAIDVERLKQEMGEVPQNKIECLSRAVEGLSRAIENRDGGPR